ncbi:gluconolactonase [Skermanella stibiiresistens SB22]|uniref:Gluconolactonase n=1 Tax=Skermanella stibiiresistens SB22 TaxID=1385369 RepID=W9GXL6_9PROT|nr:SMP-30/gluconolactonase/LRE family protein [Skermanella stibiiresistens]EWY36218.1 gluconolactonase [Skermanella stibiiresistens SB22]
MEIARRALFKTAAAGAATLAAGPALARDWGDPQPVRYPDDAIEVVDKSFANYRVGNANVERLATGLRWAEGPVYFRDGGYLVWSDIPNNRLMRWTEESGAVSVFRANSNYTNGNTRDRQGRLISCEHGGRRVTRTEYDGSITVLIDSFEGKRLNAPNDAVVHSDGGIWFTDPGYGILSDYEGGKAQFELPTNVYRIDPGTGRATVVAGDFRRPNGLCFSPDQSKLYIADTGEDVPKQIRVFDVVDGKSLTNGRVFADMAPGLADGMRTDIDGNVWAAAGWAGEGFDGVHVFSPEGKIIGKIHLPEICSNVCFGGPRRDRLFMTGSTSLYAVYVNTKGALLP